MPEVKGQEIIPNTLPADFEFSRNDDLIDEEDDVIGQGIGQDLVTDPSYEQDPMMAAANEAAKDMAGDEGEKEEKTKEEPSQDKELRKEEREAGEKESAETEEETKEPEEETKEPEAPKLSKEDQDKINFYDNLKDSKYRRFVAQKMLEEQGLKVIDPNEKKEEIKTLDGQLSPEMQEKIKNIDPDVIDIISALSEQKVSQKIGTELQELREFKTRSEQRERANLEKQGQTMAQEFKDENKELVTKHEKQLTEMIQKPEYAGLIKAQGKKGMETLLKIVAHDDIVEQEKRTAVEAALKKTAKVAGNVQRFSHSKPSPDHVHKESGIKRGDSFIDVMAATFVEMYGD